MQINNDYFQKVISNVKKQLTNIYCSKYIIYKAIIFFVISIIVLAISFGIREFILNIQNEEYDFMKNFLSIKVIGNTGIAFSALSSNTGLVYFVQIIPIIISFAVFIFSNSIYIDIGLSMIIFGGLANVIDRGVVDNYSNINIENTVNAVVDYLYFPFIKNSAIFNIPDIFIIIGVIWIIIFILVNIIKSFIYEKKNNISPSNK